MVQTWLTNTLEHKCTTVTQITVSLGMGMFGGFIGGKVAHSLDFEPNGLLTKDPAFLRWLNEGASIEEQVGVSGLIRSGLSGLESNFPTSIWPFNRW